MIGVGYMFNMGKKVSSALFALGMSLSGGNVMAQAQCDCASGVRAWISDGVLKVEKSRGEEDNGIVTDDFELEGKIGENVGVFSKKGENGRKYVWFGKRHGEKVCDVDGILNVDHGDDGAISICGAVCGHRISMKIPSVESGKSLVGRLSSSSSSFYYNGTWCEPIPSLRVEFDFTGADSSSVDFSTRTMFKEGKVSGINFYNSEGERVSFYNDSMKNYLVGLATFFYDQGMLSPSFAVPGDIRSFYGNSGEVKFESVDEKSDGKRLVGASTVEYLCFKKLGQDWGKCGNLSVTKRMTKDLCRFVSGTVDGREVEITVCNSLGFTDSEVLDKVVNHVLSLSKEKLVESFDHLSDLDGVRFEIIEKPSNDSGLVGASTVEYLCFKKLGQDWVEFGKLSVNKRMTKDLCRVVSGVVDGREVEITLVDSLGSSDGEVLSRVVSRVVNFSGEKLVESFESVSDIV